VTIGVSAARQQPIHRVVLVTLQHMTIPHVSGKTALRLVKLARLRVEPADPPGGEIAKSNLRHLAKLVVGNRSTIHRL